MKGKRCLMLSLILSVAVLFTGCLPEREANSNRVKIGVAFPTSGNLAKIGQSCTNGVEIAADLVNEQGIRPKIELVKVDVPDAVAAVHQVNRLILKEEIKVIVGTYSSPISMATSGITERNRVVLWEVAATDPRLTRQGFRYVFRPNPDAVLYGPATVRFLSEVVAPKLGLKKEEMRMALIHEDGDYGEGVAASTREAAKKAGIPIVEEIRYNAKTTNDLSSAILRLKRVQPDIINMVQYDTDAQLFWKQAKQLGLNAKVFIGNGAGQSSDNFGHTFGKAANGVLDTSSAIAVNPEALIPEMRQIEKTFIQRYKQKFGKEPDLIARLAFSSAYILFHDVIPKAGGDNPDKIRQSALSLDQPVGSTLVGWGVKFDKTGQNTRATLSVMQWQDGKLKVIYPENFKKSEPIMIPMSDGSER
ncbi:ABC transporter ATP-binding protein [Polycladomyces abyssicola]|uniref:ABC transporter ATP-binding protein n=1 Tax=Polycladomyces abyssicola TaxID=1125966 RepID=A0A8D5ZPN7_9BACL|nr:ABC transporter substrate-binding protein [Polycladomyces abyssicola]BCU82591.1 ABC transporter ATP-binding protein [Polycladomyces abyssicola]